MAEQALFVYFSQMIKEMRTKDKISCIYGAAPSRTPLTEVLHLRFSLFPSTPEVLLYSAPTMSSLVPRSGRPLGNSLFQQPQQRKAQFRRHLTTTPNLRHEIRDAYILSAARTPTGKVRTRIFL